MLFVGGMFFYACDESDDGNGDVVEKTCYLDKMYENDILSLEITWNTDNQLSMISFYNEEGIKDGYLEVTWADGKVTKTQEYYLDEKKASSFKWSSDIQLKFEKLGIKSFSTDMYWTYTYTDDKLTRSDVFQNYDGEWTSPGYLIFEHYGNSNYITKATFMSVEGESESELYYSTYEYFVGNLIKEESYVIDSSPGYPGDRDDLDYIHIYTYDDKKSAFSNNGLPMMDPVFLVSRNNILTETTDYDLDTGTKEYTHAYTYNEDNYPITEVFTDVEYGETSNFTMEYNCSE